MDDINIKILELKTKNLMSKRQLVINILVVLIGGIIGLAFMPNGALKNIFIILGVLYAMVLIKDFLAIDIKIEKLLKWK